MKFFIPSFSLFALLLSLFSGCKPMPNDGIPFFLAVDSVQLNTQTVQGLNTHRIRDIWVEANAGNLGAYERPANFPVLAEGDVRFVISAGIEQSGQSGYRVIYPFYTTDTFTLNAKRGEKYTRIPQFKYKAGCAFKFVNDFQFSNDFNGFTPVSSTDSNARYGACVMLSVNTVDSNKIASTVSAIDLPEGQEIWLEFDYKCDVPFYAGFYGEGNGSVVQDAVIFVNPRSTWNHLYVKLSEAIASVKAPTYRLYFEALRPYGSNGGNVYIDNVRLVHFNP
jgi:hypothetical protein